MDTEKDHDEEDGGDNPCGDGHKHHPAIYWKIHKDGAGYQCPVKQPRKLELETQQDMLRSIQEKHDKVLNE